MSNDLPADARAILDRARLDDPVLNVVADDPPPIRDPSNSRIAALRQVHRSIAGQHYSPVVEFPWWQGKLGARFRYLDDKGFDRLLELASGSDNPDTIRKVNADIVIRGVDEVLFRADEDADWEPLVDGEKIRIDQRLAQELQLHAGDTARSVLMALWDNPTQAAFAIGEIAGRYADWLRGRAPEVAEKMRGE